MLGGFPERALWLVYGRAFRRTSVGGLILVDIRLPSEEQHVAACAIVSDAVGNLGAATGDFGELVRKELDFMALTVEPKERVSANLRAYLTPLRGHEESNATYLAARLVYAAAFVRGWYGTPPGQRRGALTRIRQEAREQQLRFAEALPGGEEWAAFFKAQEMLLS